MDPSEQLARMQAQIQESIRVASDVPGGGPPAEVTDRVSEVSNELDALREQMRSLMDRVQSVQKMQKDTEQKARARLEAARASFAKPPWAPTDPTVPKAYPARLLQFLLD